MAVEKTKRKLPEDSYHALIKMATDMGQAIVMLRDMDGIEGVQVFVSDIWLDTTGYSQDELLGKSVFDLVSPKDKEASLARHRKKMSGIPTPGKFNLSIIRKDGKEALVELSSAVSFSDGTPTKIAFIRDITPQVEAEAKAKEYQDQFYTIAELGANTGEAIVILQNVDGVEGRYVFVNELWPRITEYTREELLTMSAFDIIGPEHTEAAKKRYRSIIAGQIIPRAFEASVIAKSGMTIPVEITITPINYNNRNSALVSIRDITQRKLIENELQREKERYKSIFDNIPLSVCEVDYSDSKRFIDALRAQGITDFNAYFDEHPDAIFEFTYRQKIISSNKACNEIYEVDTEEDWAKIGLVKPDRSKKSSSQDPKLTSLSHMKTALLNIIGNQRQQSFESIIYTAKGNKRNIHFWHSIAPRHEDDLSRVFITTVDITDRIKAENKVKEYQNYLEDIIKERTLQLQESLYREQKLSQNERELRRELESKMKQRSDFNRMLVHELKTPLVPLLGTSSILLREIKDEPYHSLITNVNRGALSLSRRIDELLDLEKADAGALAVNLEEVDILSLLRQTFTFVSSQAKEKEQEFTLELPPTLPFVMGDIERLRQVLLNLLSNAFKYTPYSGKIVLRAKTEADRIIVEVQDNGQGVSLEKQAKLFSPYYYLDENESHRSGFGIGLALCKRLIELQKGTIWLYSVSGRGSVFSFSLPTIK